MAINRSVDQQPVSVAEAQLARVAGDGCARHPHLNAFSKRPAALRAATSPTRCTCCAAFTVAIRA